MCNFVSWIEKDKLNYFLTPEQIYNTQRGKELQKWSRNIEDDKLGHGAIRWYYNLEGGEDRECIDFSKPDNFPPEIVSAIKDGRMLGMAVVRELLTKKAQAEYNKVCETALTEYNKVWGAARAEYNKVRETAWAEYEKVCDPAWAEYKKVRETARAEYNKVRDPALTENNKVCETALTEYNKVWGAARAEYNKVWGAAFWNLFAKKSNRIEAWR